MENQIKTYTYGAQGIEFDHSNRDIMVNATEMAKIFGTDLGQFFRNESTKLFIEECLNPANSQDLGIETQDDLYISRQRSGTWMHRVLALKFAAWLDPRFELWVYLTIDKLLFGELRQLLEEKVGKSIAQDTPQRKRLMAQMEESSTKIEAAKERIQQGTVADQIIVETETKRLKMITRQMQDMDKKVSQSLNTLATQLDITFEEPQEAEVKQQ